MKVKTFKGLFWKSIFMCILLNIFFCMIETFFIDGLDLAYTPSLWLAFELLQMLSSLVLGFSIRKKTNYKIFENDEDEKKYIKYIFVCMICSIIILTFPDVIAMPYLFAATKVYEITGLQLIFFSYFDLWSISVCLGYVFFGIQHKKS